MEISGSRVLLTGATGGIGHAIARDLTARGAKVILTGRRSEVLQPLAQEIGGIAVAADLSVRSDVERLASEFPDVDIIVHNAAIPGTGALDSFAPDELDRVLEVNFRAPIALTAMLLPAMKDRGTGHIVLVSSISGKVPTPDASLYGGTKMGIRGFAQGLRAELVPKGLGVTTVFPGFIRDAGMWADTGLELPAGVGTNSPEEVAAAVAKGILKNKGEITVAPVGLRISSLINGLAPGRLQAISSKLGLDKIGVEVAEAQRSKR